MELLLSTKQVPYDPPYVPRPTEYHDCGEQHRYPDSVRDGGPCYQCCHECADLLEVFLQDDSYSARQCYKSALRTHVSKMHKGSTSHVGNGAHLGAWAFTLTKSPTDELTEEQMVRAVRKLMAQKSCPVDKYAWYLEHKDGGTHPHIHGMYQTSTGGKIETKHFKRVWPIWNPKEAHGAGFRGGYHRPVRSDEKYSAYICKDGGIGDSKV